MNTTAHPSHKVLMRRIASIDVTQPGSVQFAARLKEDAADVLIPADKTFEVRDALGDKIQEILADSDSPYSQPVLQELAGAVAAVDGQIAAYEQKFELAKSGQKVGDEVGFMSAGTVSNPTRGAGRPNGHATAS